MRSKEDILRCLNENREVLKERFGVEKIALFGSVARDDATENSDIDLFVSFDRRTFRKIAATWNFLEKKLGNKVDLVYDHPGLRESLRREIERDMIDG